MFVMLFVVVRLVVYEVSVFVDIVGPLLCIFDNEEPR